MNKVESQCGIQWPLYSSLHEQNRKPMWNTMATLLKLSGTNQKAYVGHNDHGTPANMNEV